MFLLGTGEPLCWMAAMNLRRKKVKPKEEAAYFTSVCKDKDGFDVKYINSEKGRGVFSCVHFDKGDFLFEYRGDLISKHESENRQKLYHDALKVFMFEFRYNGKLFCVDASLDDGSLGRLVNDDHLNPNSKMRTITTGGKPHLCLFATRSINPGEEITYNYGDSEWPWRCKIVNERDQLHPQEQTSNTKSEAVPAQEASNSVIVPALPPVIEMEPNITERTNLVTTSPILAKKDQQQSQPQNLQALSKGEEIVNERDQLHPQEQTSNTKSEDCQHKIVIATVSSMNKCVACDGPFASLKWIGLKCKVCSCFWHKTCFTKMEKNVQVSVSWVCIFRVF
ncbi:histone-lysine N-methyltransferase SETD5 isoform X7 [Astyanax mexicanus]|uniref:histone-lysine N-methyltransferase SETD5 isoform X7 n=1 Tax=Astyanax mexicanus TaxID=7994 RepID=UPI0020CB0CBC|nr:histone-lysine N-methyltransferase SETD5 isoform X7 [Astyanax mexicanus]